MWMQWGIQLENEVKWYINNSLEMVLQKDNP